MNTRLGAGLLALALLLPAPATPVLAEGAAAKPSLPEPPDAAVRARERAAMIAFYNAMGGPDWIQRDFWGSDRPVGEWHGVTTDADGYIVTLTIYDNNVTGRLSPAICGLARLQTLHLSFNNILGTLPNEIGNCRALKNLWLKGNKITGRLPD